MKAYPLIYSRTKYEDFVPDFLTRPDDLDWNKANIYVNNAMKNIDNLNNVRYSVFKVGKYCICGGIACLSSTLAKMLNKTNADEYLHDCKGRSIACFVGFAIEKGSTSGNFIPDIDLDKYWEIYLDYLKKQWEEPVTKSEKLNFPPIELSKKSYIDTLNPVVREEIQNKGIIRHFDENIQEILDYYFDLLLNKGKNVSFISNINNTFEWDNLIFDNVAVSDNLYENLKYKPQTENSSNTMNSVNDLSNLGISRPFTNQQSKINNSVNSNLNIHYPDNKNNEKKTPLKLLLGIVAAVIALIILIATAIRSVSAQTPETVQEKECSAEQKEEIY